MPDRRPGGGTMLPVPRRLLRYLLKAATALSLLLFVAVCVLWVRSYSTADLITRSYGPTSTTRAAIPVFGPLFAPLSTQMGRVDITHCRGWVSIRDGRHSFIGSTRKVPTAG